MEEDKTGFFLCLWDQDWVKKWLELLTKGALGYGKIKSSSFFKNNKKDLGLMSIENPRFR